MSSSSSNTTYPNTTIAYKTGQYLHAGTGEGYDLSKITGYGNNPAHAFADAKYKFNKLYTGCGFASNVVHFPSFNSSPSWTLINSSTSSLNTKWNDYNRPHTPANTHEFAVHSHTLIPFANQCVVTTHGLCGPESTLNQHSAAITNLKTKGSKTDCRVKFVNDDTKDNEEQMWKCSYPKVTLDWTIETRGFCTGSDDSTFADACFSDSKNYSITASDNPFVDVYLTDPIEESDGSVSWGFPAPDGGPPCDYSQSDYGPEQPNIRLNRDENGNWKFKINYSEIDDTTSGGWQEEYLNHSGSGYTGDTPSDCEAYAQTPWLFYPDTFYETSLNVNTPTDDGCPILGAGTYSVNLSTPWINQSAAWSSADYSGNSCPCYQDDGSGGVESGCSNGNDPTYALKLTVNSVKVEIANAWDGVYEWGSSANSGTTCNNADGHPPINEATCFPPSNTTYVYGLKAAPLTYSGFTYMAVSSAAGAATYQATHKYAWQTSLVARPHAASGHLTCSSSAFIMVGPKSVITNNCADLHQRFRVYAAGGLTNVWFQTMHRPTAGASSVTATINPSFKAGDEWAWIDYHYPKPDRFYNVVLQNPRVTNMMLNVEDARGCVTHHNIQFNVYQCSSASPSCCATPYQWITGRGATLAEAKNQANYFYDATYKPNGYLKTGLDSYTQHFPCAPAASSSSTSGGATPLIAAPVKSNQITLEQAWSDLVSVEEGTLPEGEDFGSTILPPMTYGFGRHLATRPWSPPGSASNPWNRNHGYGNVKLGVHPTKQTGNNPTTTMWSFIPGGGPYGRPMRGAGGPRWKLIPRVRRRGYAPRWTLVTGPSGTNPPANPPLTSDCNEYHMQICQVDSSKSGCFSSASPSVNPCISSPQSITNNNYAGPACKPLTLSGVVSCDSGVAWWMPVNLEPGMNFSALQLSTTSVSYSVTWPIPTWGDYTVQFWVRDDCKRTTAHPINFSINCSNISVNPGGSSICLCSYIPPTSAGSQSSQQHTTNSSSSSSPSASPSANPSALPLLGACCLPWGGCLDNLNKLHCEQIVGGAWTQNTACSLVTCASPSLQSFKPRTFGDCGCSETFTLADALSTFPTQQWGGPIVYPDTATDWGQGDIQTANMVFI